MDQLIIPSLVFFVILITCLLDIVLILMEGEILSWSLMGVKGLNMADYLGRTCVGMLAKFVPDIL